ncbi:MAG: hypothetical protein O9341_20205 [Paucibacter sp.]|nr:hypothetical protein [Roseateles sp.]
MHHRTQPRPVLVLNGAAWAAVLVGPLLAMPLAAQAETETRSAQVYRCGPQGRDLRDSPCPEGREQASKTIAFDQPSEADRRAAQALAKDDARRAREMEAQRLKAEADAQRRAAPAIGIHGRGQAASAPQQAKSTQPPQPKAPKPPKAPKAPKPLKPITPAGLQAAPQPLPSGAKPGRAASAAS